MASPMMGPGTWGIAAEGSNELDEEVDAPGAIGAAPGIIDAAGGNDTPECVRFVGALLISGGAWRKLSFRGRCSLVGVIGTLLLFGVGSPCGADPPSPGSGSNLFEAVAIAAGGGMMADVAGPVVEDDDGPGAGVEAVGAIVAAGF
jgi:hypothetical protein